MDRVLNKGSYFHIQAEGQVSLKQAIVYKHYPYSEQKQPEAKVKVKETDQHGIIFCSSLLQVGLIVNNYMYVKHFFVKGG